MNATQAIDQLDPIQWSATSAADRIKILKQIRENLSQLGGELAVADAGMKNKILGEETYSREESLVGTVMPLAGSVTAAIDLYEHLVKEGKMPEPLDIQPAPGGRHDILVYPRTVKDKVLAADQKAWIRVKGEPHQTNPLDKPAGIIGVLGAGNYSSSLEMIKALFFENCAVVHKPHSLNYDTDQIWEKVLHPLIEAKALSFCDPDQGRELTADPRLSKIYFTGGADTAKAITASTDTPLISECGGNNPCIIIPGDRPWTEKEIEHQAIQLATIDKMNGGAVCGRVQTIVTSKHWPQREAFLTALEKAIREQTPATASYYPGSEETFAKFRENYPDAKLIQPENGKRKHSDVLLITGAEPDGFAAYHEAFCLVITEIPLDVPADAKSFFPAATAFCNEKLLGTLGCAILCDGDTLKTHKKELRQAVDDLNYGGIAVNTMPPFVFLSPYLTWGGNEDGKELVSGRGNFGNGLCFDNVEKSILMADFTSAGHMLNTNVATFKDTSEKMAWFSAEPSWRNLGSLIFAAVKGSFRKKDF